MSIEAQKIWNNILGDFKSQISASAFKTWLGGSFVLDYKKNTDRDLLIIGIKNNFLKEQIESRYSPRILQIAKNRGFPNIEIVFVVTQKEDSGQVKNEPIFTGTVPKIIINGHKSEILNPGYTFDNFVVGSSNNLALIVARQVATSLGSAYNPLLIYGPSGVGKTHLLQAIGNEVLNQASDARVLYVTAEKFTNDYIESLRNRTQSSFRNKYRQGDLLLVDDVQFLAGKESTQDEFFHTFNELCLSGRQIVLACDRHPKELGRLKERLASRFLGGMAADIGLPDLEMKMAILTSKCQERGVNLEDEIIDFLARVCKGSARELEGILISILALAKIGGGQITLEEVKMTVNKSQEATKISLTPGKIIDVVCRHFRISSGDLRSPSRRASRVFARQTLMYLLRRELGLPLAQIGEIVGGRDHSTVIHGIERIEKLANENRAISDEVLRVETLLNK